MFELDHQPIDVDATIIRYTKDGRAVVGYLNHDDNPMDPFTDWDGNGRFFDRRRGGLTGEQEVQIKESPAVFLCDVYSHGGDTWRLRGSGRAFPDEQWDVSRGAGIWIADESTVDGAIFARIDDLLKPTVQFMDYGEARLPDGTVVSVQGEVSKLRLIAKAFGIEVPPDEELLKTPEAMAYFERTASSAIQEYNSILSGDVYCVCVQVFGPKNEPLDEHDECTGGYVGRDYAEESLASSVETTLTYLEKPKEAPDA